MALTKDKLIIGCVPAVCMLLFTILGLGIKVPDNIAGALQHFAAGLLLAAIGSELLPVLLDAEGVVENVYATVGFFAGMAVLIVLGALLPEAHGHSEDEDDDDEDDDSHVDHAALSKSIGLAGSVRAAFLGGSVVVQPSVSLRQAAKKINEDYCNGCDTVHEAHADGSGEGQALLKPGKYADAATEQKVVKALEVVDTALPLSFLAAIVVDSIMDGLLIGISGAAGPGAVIMMAGSISVEMGFVGLTLATACHGMPYTKAIPAALAGPIALMLGAVLGTYFVPCCSGTFVVVVVVVDVVYVCCAVPVHRTAICIGCSPTSLFFFEIYHRRQLL